MHCTLSNRASYDPLWNGINQQGPSALSAECKKGMGSLWGIKICAMDKFTISFSFRDQVHLQVIVKKSKSCAQIFEIQNGKSADSEIGAR